MLKNSNYLMLANVVIAFSTTIIAGGCGGGGTGGGSGSGSGPGPGPTPRPTQLPTPRPTTPSNTAAQKENALATLITQAQNQQRPTMRRNSILAAVARQRAEDMARRNYFSHTNPDGHGPNYLVQQAGYRLPSFYDQSPAGNNIESIAAGNSTAAETYQQWLNSPGHRRHMLAEIPFYAEQLDYGIGYASVPGSAYTHYWVLLTARH